MAPRPRRTHRRHVTTRLLDAIEMPQPPALETELRGAMA